MRMKKAVAFLFLVALGSGHNLFAQQPQGNNNAPAVDPAERARMKEELKRELKKELLDAMRQEAEAERQKKQELNRLKEEVRQELMKEMKESARQDQELRSQLKEELMNEIKNDARTQQQIRNEIKEELIQEYRQEQRTQEQIRRELKEELRKEVEHKREKEIERDVRRDERDQRRKERDERQNELRDERDERDERTHSRDRNHDRYSDDEHLSRRERKELRREEKEEDKRKLRDLKLRLERGRQSGVNFGLMAGVNLSNFNKNDAGNIGDEQLAGFVGGGFFRFHSRWFYFQPEILYSGKGADFGIKTADNQIDNQRLRLNSLDVPLMVGVKLLEGRKLNLRLHAGSLVSVLLSTKGGDQAKQDNFKTLTAGYQAGLGIDIGNLTFDVRYEGSFSDLTSEEGRRSLSVNNLHNQIFRASLGFKIF
jgi:hypothetical protein